MKRATLWTTALAAIALGWLPAAAADKVKIDVGSVPSLSGGPLYIAKEKGYYDALGLDVEIHRIAGSADAQAMLATNRMQVIAGAVSAGFFNSVEKDLPVTIVLSRNITPTYHNLLVRADLKDVIKTPADLKGRTVMMNARGSIASYEVDAIIAKGGLSLKDIEIKYMPFNQAAVALENKAVDAAMMIPPLSEVIVQKGFAVKFADPDDYVTAKPLLIAVQQMNTDWAAKHPDAAKSFVFATLRGAREYCSAYHGGSNRGEVLKMLAKYSDLNDIAMIDKMDWGARDPLGRVPQNSVMAIQDFYFKQGYIAKKFPFERLVRTDWVDDANRRLGAFSLEKDDGRPGCR
ncbi:MAG: ABC transporter substrate-binding protein [Rhodospirillales bacterium]